MVLALSLLHHLSLLNFLKQSNIKIGLAILSGSGKPYTSAFGLFKTKKNMDNGNTGICISNGILYILQKNTRLKVLELSVTFNFFYILTYNTWKGYNDDEKTRILLSNKY